MKEKGAVICFHKFTGGETFNPNCTEGPVCLGYFGRVHIYKVSSFKDYLKLTSTKDADSACSRKQLLLHCFEQDEYAQEIEIQDNTEKKMPFCGADGTSYALCCCMAININAKSNTKIKEAAKKLYECLSPEPATRQYRFAITGLLGSEDLCIILLSDDYDVLSNAVSTIQATKNDSDDYIVDNSHSILIIDTLPENAKKIKWGDAKATIHFSLITAGAWSRLEEMKKTLEKKDLAKYSSVKLDSQSGEYDATLTGPAEMLSVLYNSEDGYLRYNNKDCWNNIYQAETTMHPFGMRITNIGKIQQEGGHSNTKNIDTFVKKIIEEIEAHLGEDNSGTTYVEYAIRRLQKDYHRVVLHPFGVKLREDLEMQFSATLTAIVEAAKQCEEMRQKTSDIKAVDPFYKTLTRVTDAFLKSMEAICQSDRLGYHEQASSLQNIGSYYKILRCYYGIIKDVLKLLYGIQHTNGSEQYYLIPILSFDLSPIPTSERYKCTYKEKEAYLISITLPYHALTNPAKYLGILVHEIFHYAAPTNRAERNRILIEYLVRAALSEFISILAKWCLGRSKDYGPDFYGSNPALFNETAKHVTALVNAELKQKFGSDLSDLRAAELKENMLQLLCFDRDSTSEIYKRYYQIWGNIRKQLLKNIALCKQDERKLFALDIEALSESEKKKEFARLVQRIGTKDIERMTRNLQQCAHAFGELRPDLIDLGAVLYQQDNKRKLLQYFWQLYGVEKHIGIKPIESTYRVPLTMHAFRTGFVIEYLLSDNTNLLHEWLDDWHEDDNFKKEKEKKFEVYLYYSRPFSEVVMKFCALIEGEIALLQDDSVCEAMKRLTEFYQKYYTLCEEKKDAKDSCLDEVNKKIFYLCREIIYTYEEQETFTEICSIAPSYRIDSLFHASPTKTAQMPPKVKAIAHDAADLFRAIDKAYNEMRINGDEKPILWYRGHEQREWVSTPNIMRTKDKNLDEFSHVLHEELRLARAKILPHGNDFNKWDWITFLQHHKFKTNALDFSEALYPALFFATENWSSELDEMPASDAAVMLFNPILFNLAMEALDEGVVTERLNHYLTYGKVAEKDVCALPLFAQGEPLDDYTYLFDWDKAIASNDQAKHPRAALFPKNSNRMKQQIGQFVFYDLRSKADKDVHTFDHWSLESLQEEYFALLNNDKIAKPFLYTIIINRKAYHHFKEYQHAIGMRKYLVYPEYDKMAEDLASQLGL